VREGVREVELRCSISFENQTLLTLEQLVVVKHEHAVAQRGEERLSVERADQVQVDVQEPHVVLNRHPLSQWENLVPDGRAAAPPARGRHGAISADSRSPSRTRAFSSGPRKGNGPVT
jgi:hypothetical protein